MLHLPPYMIIEATTLSQSIVLHNHATFMTYVLSEVRRLSYSIASHCQNVFISTHIK